MAARNPLQLVGEACRKTGIRVILIGGFAVHQYGFDRNTVDLDLLTTDENYDKLFGYLKRAEYREFTRNEAFAQLVSDKPYWMDIDVSFVDPTTFQEMLNAGERAELDGEQFTVPALFHLIAMKLHAIKCNPENRFEKDMLDILVLTRKNKIDARSGEFKALCSKYGPCGIHGKIEELMKHG